MAGVKLTDAERPIAELPHASRQEPPAAFFYVIGLTVYQVEPCAILIRAVAKHPRGRWFTAGPDVVPSRHTNRAGRVGISERNPTTYQPIQVGCMDDRIAECGDRIEPLLVGHDEEHVWLCAFHPSHVNLY